MFTGLKIISQRAPGKIIVSHSVKGDVISDSFAVSVDNGPSIIVPLITTLLLGSVAFYVGKVSALQLGRDSHVTTLVTRVNGLKCRLRRRYNLLI